MGMCPISRMSRIEEDEEEREENYEYKKLLYKMRLMQQEIAFVMSLREKENSAYEREVLAFTFKEAKWRKERANLREEIERLQRKEICNEIVDSGIDNEKDCCFEMVRQERARRDEAVEKWKKLYLAIKDELDDLILRTSFQGDGLCWRPEEDEFMEQIQKEINAKDETIVALTTQVASMEEEEYKRKREIDILRQSLRILCNKKDAYSPKYGC